MQDIIRWAHSVMAVEAKPSVLPDLDFESEDIMEKADDLLVKNNLTNAQEYQTLQLEAEYIKVIGAELNIKLGNLVDDTIKQIVARQQFMHSNPPTMAYLSDVAGKEEQTKKWQTVAYPARDTIKLASALLVEKKGISKRFQSLRGKLKI